MAIAALYDERQQRGDGRQRLDGRRPAG